MHDLSPHAKGFLITLAGVVVLSPDALLVRLIDADDWTILFYRGVLSVLAIVAFLAIRHGSAVGRPFGRLDRPGFAAAVLYGIGNICFVLSINRTLVANTLVILAAQPLIAAALSHLFLHERQRRATWVAVLVVLAGLGAIFAGSVDGGHLAGDVLALASAAAMAANLTVLRRSRLDDPLPTVVLGGAFAAAVALPFAAPFAVSGHDLVVLGVAGAGILPVSFGLIFLGPKYLPAPEVALMLLLETVLGPLLVWMVLAEVPPVSIVLAGAVIAATVGIHSVTGLRRGGT